jgi:hypothetical protein
MTSPSFPIPHILPCGNLPGASALGSFFSFVGGFRTSPHDGPGVAALPQYARLPATIRANAVATQRVQYCSSELNRFGILADAVFSALAGAVFKIVRFLSVSAHKVQPSERDIAHASKVFERAARLFVWSANRV